MSNETRAQWAAGFRLAPRISTLIDYWQREAQTARANGRADEYARLCEETVAALADLAELRQKDSACRNCGGTRGPDHDCPALGDL